MTGMENDAAIKMAEEIRADRKRAEYFLLNYVQELALYRTRREEYVRGERLEIEVDGVWVKTRMEMNPKQQWYLVGTPYCDGDLENMRARVSRTLQEAW